MKVMKKKIIGILIAMLMLAIIPVAAGMGTEERALGKVYVSGFIGFSRLSLGGKYISFFAISVRHGTPFGENGVWRAQIVRMKNDFLGIMAAPIILGVFTT